MTEENDELKKVEEEIRTSVEPPKPPSVPLFKIPDAVLNSMSKEVSPDLSQIQNPVEWIMKQRKMAEAQVQEVKETPPTMPTTIVPTQVPVTTKKRENVPVVAWGGADVSEDTLVTLFYLVLQEASKNKEIKKKLKDMKIEVYSAQGELLWP